EIGIPNHSGIAQKVFAFVYKFADKVICVSQSVKDHLIKAGEIQEYKGRVIYNPVSVPEKFPKQENGNFNIVYVGRLEKVKNVETLIKAFSKMNNEAVRLTIVGEGRERENLEKIVKESNVPDKVTFIGFSNEPSRYLCSADLFV